MKCTKCGKENRNEAVFCRFCGEEIENVEQPAQPEQQSQPVIEQQPVQPVAPTSAPKNQDNFIGHAKIRAELEKFINTLSVKKRREKILNEPDLKNHIFLFSGNTGTGKFTLAQWFAKKLKSQQLINGKIKDFYAKELKKQFEDESAIKQFLNQNNYGVLIIREVHFDTDYLNELLRALSLNESGTICICLGLKAKLDTYFEGNPDNRQRINDFYELSNYDDTTLEEILESKLKEKKYKYNTDAADKLLQYTTEENNKEEKSHENGWLIEKDIIPSILKIQADRITKMVNPSDDDLFTILEDDIPAKTSRRTEEEIFADLDSLIGLTSLKKQIRELMATIKANKKREKQGIEGSIPAIHIEFIGNPGTGKTTVARLLGELFNAIGLLPSSKVIQVDRSKLVAGYVGQTSPKVNEYCDKAMGGILFVDEAYDLCRGKDDLFGNEAVTALLLRMENDRGKFVVIAAGYKNEMAKFIATNSGFESRFTHKIELPDYNEQELFEIFKLYTKKQQYTLNRDAESILKQVIKKIYASRGETFANARTIRNLFEATIRRQSNRTMKLPVEQQTTAALMEIKAEDIQEAE